ncbi:MAG: hypothetical protein K1X94_05565 [Sandaracinaceae bacterium]|nr:hypothetical protein [Sandaracinaceae bacterium]
MGRSLGLGILVVFLVACGAQRTPILGGGPGRAGDPEIFDDALRGVRTLSYQPTQLRPEQGSFVVIARSDRSGATQFRVQCFREGYVSVVPEGPAVERVGEDLHLSGRLREEYLRVATAVSNAIEVRP